MGVAEIVMERRIAAPIERVFRAWTEPERLSSWFMTGGKNRTQATVSDLRPGGSYEIQIDTGKMSFTVFGEYREVSPPNRLSFTWQWKHEGDEVEISLVTVDLQEDGDATLLTLTHSQLLCQESFDNHSEGWVQALRLLEDYVMASTHF